MSINLIDFTQNLGNQSQNFCSKSSSSNILSRLVVGIFIKDIARIYDIAIHTIVGLGKLASCTVKVSYSIPARLYGSNLNYDIGKEGLAHLGFSGFYLADIFISLTNMVNGYPKDTMEKIESFFSEFLPNLQKNITVQEEKPKTQIKEELHNKDLFSQEYLKYSVKHSPKTAEGMAKIFAKSHPELFSRLYAEYIGNNKTQEKIERRATEYAKNCIRIYSPMYLKFSKENSEKEAKEQALLYAKAYVNAYSKEAKRQPSTQSEQKRQKQADMYAKYFTKLFFLEYQCCLKDTPEIAEKQAMVFAEKHIEIFYRIWNSLPQIPEERTKEIKESLFKDYIREIPKVIKEGRNPEFYFTSYAQKYVECQRDGRKKEAAKIAKKCPPRELTPEMVAKFNKAKMKSVLHKKK